MPEPVTVSPGCASRDCDAADYAERPFLARPHLRVQISPPGQPWVMLRFCDAICLQDWLEAEASGAESVVFTREEWIDSRG